MLLISNTKRKPKVTTNEKMTDSGVTRLARGDAPCPTPSTR